MRPSRDYSRDYSVTRIVLLAVCSLSRLLLKEKGSMKIAWGVWAKRCKYLSFAPSDFLGVHVRSSRPISCHGRLLSGRRSVPGALSVGSAIIRVPATVPGAWRELGGCLRSDVVCKITMRYMSPVLFPSPSPSVWDPRLRACSKHAS